MLNRNERERKRNVFLSVANTSANVTYVNTRRDIKYKAASVVS